MRKDKHYANIYDSESSKSFSIKGTNRKKIKEEAKKLMLLHGLDRVAIGRLYYDDVYICNKIHDYEHFKLVGNRLVFIDFMR